MTHRRVNESAGDRGVWGMSFHRVDAPQSDGVAAQVATGLCGLIREQCDGRTSAFVRAGRLLRGLVFAGTVVGFGIVDARADEPGKATSPQTADVRDGDVKPDESSKKDAVSKVDADEAARQVKLLTTGTAVDRIRATTRLLELKQAAIEPLVKAAGEGDRATMFYCFDVLQKLLAHDDEATSKATNAALDKLQQSPNPSVVMRAKSVQRIHEVMGKRAIAPGINIGPQAVPLGGGININIQAGGIGTGFQMQTRVVNGVRTVDVIDGKEKITINDESGKNITLKHTRTIDGKEKIDQYKGADLDDLRKNHPEAAKLYEKYIAKTGLAQVQIQANGVGAVPFPRTYGVGANVPSGPRTIGVELEDRRLEITDDGGRDLCVKVIKTIDGKDVAEEFKAETPKQLKADHPEIAMLYEKYTGTKAE